MTQQGCNKKNSNPVYETAKETLMYRSLMDSVGEGEGGKDDLEKYCFYLWLACLNTLQPWENN